MIEQAKLFEVDDQVTVAGQPSLVQLLRLKNLGFRSVVNLRDDEEWDLPLSPEIEGTKVREFGLLYRHMPLKVEDIDEAAAERFARELTRQPAPKLVHCGTGERATTLVLMALAKQAGQTASDVFARAEELERPIENQSLRALVETCLPDPVEEEEEVAAEATA